MYVIFVCAPLGTFAIQDFANRFVDLAGQLNKQGIVINESEFRLDIEKTTSEDDLDFYCEPESQGQDLSISNYVKIDGIKTQHDYLIKQGVIIAIEEMCQKINSFKAQGREKEQYNDESVPDFLLVIGHRLYSNKELMALASIKLFMENSPEKCLAQYLYSDLKNSKSMVDFYEKEVKPLNDNEINPARNEADIIIPENGNLEAILELLLLKINSQNRRNEDVFEVEPGSIRSNGFFS